jgi:uncharacterized membrane protein (UPF0127 family)
MKKIAFPWIDGHDQSSELSEHPMDDTTSQWYDTFSPSGGRNNILIDTDNHSLSEYSEGAISPVEDFESLLVSLDRDPDQTSVLVVEADHVANSLKKMGYNVVSFSGKPVGIDNNYIRKISGDIRFYNFDKKFDIIIFNSNKINSKIAHKNILNHLLAHSYLIDLSGKTYVNDSRHSETLVRTELKNGDILSFGCNIAADIETKTIGLQSYSSLPSDSGLLFKYEAPTDVAFHMGTVGFPIDIIFANENGLIIKISKNIAPGDLELYCCGDVSRVLEIAGGLTSKLGIDVGDVMYEDKPTGIEKTLMARDKSAKPLSRRHGGGKIEKFAAYRDAFSNSIGKDISIFTLDDQIFSKESSLKVYSARKVGQNDMRIYRDVNNCTFASDFNPASISLDSLGKSNALRSPTNRIAIGQNQSMCSFSVDRVSLKNIDLELKSNSKVVVATSGSVGRRDLEFILHSKLACEFPGAYYSNKISVMHIPDDFDDYDIMCAANAKYLANSVKLFDKEIVKTSGIPVPDQVKAKAKHARKFFVRAEESIEKILNDLNYNMIEYEKYTADLDTVKNSKGEFNRSTKRISKKVKDTLIQIRDGIRILNSIKDVSSTVEMIDRLTVGAKEYSSHINSIFELINIISTPDFVAKHSENVNKTIALGGDLSSSLIRVKNYIDSNILGITILSE